MSGARVLQRIEEQDERIEALVAELAEVKQRLDRYERYDGRPPARLKRYPKLAKSLRDLGHRTPAERAADKQKRQKRRARA